MKLSDLIVKYVNRENRERELGRFYASEVYGIMKGYKKPKDFFDPKPIDEYGCHLISEGVAIEDYLNKIFEEMKVPVKMQEKKVLKVNDEIVISCKPDYIFENRLVDLKRPKNTTDSFPDKWRPQAEVYFRCFGLPVSFWQVRYPITITELTYKPSDKLWEEMKEALVKYHQKVVKLSNK